MHTRMLTTHELIDLAKQALAVRHQLTLPMSDYRLADLMDVPEGTMSNWRRGKSVIGTERAQSFADATGLPVEYIYACLEHERSNSTEVKGILQTIAGQFYPAATVAPSILLAMLVLTAAPNLVMADTFAGYHAVSDTRTKYVLYTFRIYLIWHTFRRFLARFSLMCCQQSTGVCCIS